MKKVIKLLNMDFPDPDVIRVGDTYYMISTTMHFCPGAQILSSTDLIHWKHASYVYEIPEVTPAGCLENSSHIYGKGMWAASLRYHDGVFYVCFVANDTHKTYLYRAFSVEGPWEMNEIAGFYHDCSLLFDEGRVFIVYGNTQIYITELNDSLTAPKEGGLNKMILEDRGDIRLGYEGAHLYKLDGKYYLFLIHWPNSGAARRTQSCFVADFLDGEWIGRDIYDWDGGFRHSGVAQGGIVDTPEGEYYAILFQDSGAVGRIPVLVPMEFVDGWPVLCEVPETGYSEKIHQIYGKELYFSDDFSNGLDVRWQWNHIPDFNCIQVNSERKTLKLTTGRLSSNLTLARNILTQRMLYPSCAAEVTINGEDLKAGDYAGLCALEGSYSFIALTKNTDGFALVVKHRPDNKEIWGFQGQDEPDYTIAVLPWNVAEVRFRLEASFRNDDVCLFRYHDGSEWKQLGETCPLVFRLDHFSGCRFGLFLYSTKETGGSASFRDFRYSNPNGLSDIDE